MGLMARLRSYARDAFVLAKVDLKSLDGLSTQTFYASTAPVITPDGQAWDPLILSAGPVSARGGLGATDISLATANLVLANRKVGFQTSGTTTSLLSAHRFIGSTVTLYLWERGHTTFPDGQVFKGTVIGCESSVNGVELSLRQSTDWNRPVAPRYVNKKDYPRAPDSSVGLPIPLVYGRISGLGLRRPWLSPFGTGYHALEHLRGGRRVAKAVLVDAGRGGGAAQNPDARVLVAGHAAKSVIDAAQGTMMFMERDGKLALLESPSSVINNATEAGIKLVDNFDFAWLGLPPAEVMVNANSALNPRHTLEPNDITFAYLNLNDGYLDLRLRMPSVPGPGEMVERQVVIGYQSSSDFDGCRMLLFNDASTLLEVLIDILPVKTTPGEASSALMTTGWGFDLPWDFATSRAGCQVRAAGIPASWLDQDFLHRRHRSLPTPRGVAADRALHGAV